MIIGISETIRIFLLGTEKRVWRYEFMRRGYILLEIVLYNEAGWK